MNVMKEFPIPDEKQILGAEFRSDYLQLHRQNIEVRDAMAYAATIQQGLLPHRRHFERYFREHFILYKPLHLIGGDFYWIAEKDDCVVFAVADCSGHGIAGCMLSVLGISFLNYVVLGKEFTDLGLVLNEIDKKWIETFDNGPGIRSNNDWMQIAICSYNRKTRELFYAGAKEGIILANRNGCEMLAGNNYPIGGWQIEKNRNFECHRAILDRDTRIYLCTDGIKDQFGGTNGKKFSRKRLLSFLHDIHDIPMNIQQTLVRMQLDEWKKELDQTDDMTLMGIRL